MCNYSLCNYSNASDGLSVFLSGIVMKVHNFELTLIDKNGQDVEVRGRTPRGANPIEVVTIPWNEINALRKRIEKKRKEMTLDEVARFGMLLSEILLPGTVRQQYRNSLMSGD